MHYTKMQLVTKCQPKFSHDPMNNPVLLWKSHRNSRKFLYLEVSNSTASGNLYCSSTRSVQCCLLIDPLCIIVMWSCSQRKISSLMWAWSKNQEDDDKPVNCTEGDFGWEIFRSFVWKDVLKLLRETWADTYCSLTHLAWLRSGFWRFCTQ